jgi:PIN domain nuclease of toxin-antitoxin system
VEADDGPRSRDIPGGSLLALMRVLLDTATFLWAYSSPELLSKKAIGALNESTARELSAVSLSEIAIKTALGKLDCQKENAIIALSDLRLRVLSYTATHAYALFDLPLYHRDPFDRQIIAQAIAEDIPIVTSDKIFRRYRGLKIIW